MGATFNFFISNNNAIANLYLSLLFPSKILNCSFITVVTYMDVCYIIVVLFRVPILD